MARNEILELIKKRQLIITPFSPSQVGPCSVDLHLGNKFKFFKKETITINKNFDYKREFGKVKKVKDNDFVPLEPNQLILGITKEKIKIPKNVCGWIQGRSRLARIGLMVHVSASLVQPGVFNHQVLEIVNMSPALIRLHPGTKVCQIVLEELSSEAEYQGVFRRQTGP